MWAVTAFCVVAFLRTCGRSVPLVFPFPLLRLCCGVLSATHPPSWSLTLGKKPLRRPCGPPLNEAARVLGESTASNPWESLAEASGGVMVRSCSKDSVRPRL